MWVSGTGFCKEKIFIPWQIQSSTNNVLFALDSAVEGKLVVVQTVCSVTHRSPDVTGRALRLFGSFSLQRFVCVVTSLCMNWWFSIGDHVEYNQASFNGEKKIHFVFGGLFQSQANTLFLHVHGDEGSVDGSITFWCGKGRFNWAV